MLKLLAADPESLDATYRDWEAQAKRTFEQLQKDPGIEPVKVLVDVEALRQWCRERGKPVDGAARAEYVGEIVQKPGEN